MYCKYCGKEINDNSKFCQYCGKKLNDEKNKDSGCTCFSINKIVFLNKNKVPIIIIVIILLILISPFLIYQKKVYKDRVVIFNRVTGNASYTDIEEKISISDMIKNYKHKQFQKKKHKIIKQHKREFDMCVSDYDELKIVANNKKNTIKMIYNKNEGGRLYKEEQLKNLSEYYPDTEITSYCRKKILDKYLK